MKTYQLEDIFKFAVDVEEQGKRFYEAGSLQAEKDEVKDLFAWLAKEEMKHAKKFLKFQKSYSRKGGSFKADARLDELLNTYMRGMIFPALTDLQEDLGRKDRNPMLSLVKAAMGVETNSVLFYEEMKSLLGEEETKDALSRIIKEEQGHLIKLKGVRLELDPYYSAIKYGSWF
jgi:rubrerythrin